MRAARNWRKVLVIVITIGAMFLMAGMARAEELEPPLPHTTYREFVIYVSSPDSGSLGNIQYADEDLLRYDTETGQWVKGFDGTDAGLPGSADIDAVAYQPINLGHIFYLSFDAPTAVPGLGTVDDSDIVAYRYVFGQGGSWQMYLDGSQKGLTTNAEDIDAIDINGAELYISTLGGFTVPKVGGGNLTGGREDVLMFSNAANGYMVTIDGTMIGLAATNNVRGYAFVRESDYNWHFLSLQRRGDLRYADASYPAVSVKPNDIGLYENPIIHGPKAFATVWSASGAGFPKVDAIEVVVK